jgi:hypothetical protein
MAMTPENGAEYNRFDRCRVLPPRRLPRDHTTMARLFQSSEPIDDLFAFAEEGVS